MENRMQTVIRRARQPKGTPSPKAPGSSAGAPGPGSTSAPAPGRPPPPSPAPPRVRGRPPPARPPHHLQETVGALDLAPSRDDPAEIDSIMAAAVPLGGPSPEGMT